MTVDKPTNHLRLVRASHQAPESSNRPTTSSDRLGIRKRALFQALFNAEIIETTMPTVQGPKIQAVKKALMANDIETLREYTDGKHGRFSYCLVLQMYLTELNKNNDPSTN